MFGWPTLNKKTGKLILFKIIETISNTNITMEDITMVPQNEISGAARKALLYTKKGHKNVIVEKYSRAKD